MSLNRDAVFTKEKEKKHYGCIVIAKLMAPFERELTLYWTLGDHTMEDILAKKIFCLFVCF